MSTTASPPRLYTPADLLEMTDGDLYELVDGRLVEKNMGTISNLVAGNVLKLLKNHHDSPLTAYIFPEQGYTCLPGEPNTMRKPDVSLVLAERKTPALFEEGYTSIPPDLAVEVVSPNDRVEDLEDKLADYRSAGIPLVWVLYPRSRKVRVIHRGLARADLGPGDDLTGEDVLPGFRCRVADLFAGLPPAPVRAG